MGRQSSSRIKNTDLFSYQVENLQTHGKMLFNVACTPATITDMFFTLQEICTLLILIKLHNIGPRAGPGVKRIGLQQH